MINYLKDGIMERRKVLWKIMEGGLTLDEREQKIKKGMNEEKGWENNLPQKNYLCLLRYPQT